MKHQPPVQVETAAATSSSIAAAAAAATPAPSQTEKKLLRRLLLLRLGALHRPVRRGGGGAAGGGGGWLDVNRVRGGKAATAGDERAPEFRTPKLSNRCWKRERGEGKENEKERAKLTPIWIY